jgi:uncharacterized membrane protein
MAVEIARSKAKIVDTNCYSKINAALKFADVCSAA